MDAGFLDNAWEEPDHTGRQHGLLVRIGRARIVAPLAFGTGEGDADRWSAVAEKETAGLIDCDRMWGIRRVIGLRYFRVAPGDYRGRHELRTLLDKSA
jgi:hypothetical protein